MKIYTGGGDKGKTSLFSGERVAKHHQRIEAYGDVDELNSVLGALASSLDMRLREIRNGILIIQTNLFSLGAWLAVTPESPAASGLPPLSPEMVSALEAAIDLMDATLPPLKSFILPGGHPCACWAHVARTVCRRCERRVTALMDAGSTPRRRDTFSVLNQYLNRLSDYLFVLARFLNHHHGVSDIPWSR